MMMMSMVYESAVVYIPIAFVVLIILVAGLYFLRIRQQQRHPGRSDVRGSRSSPTGASRAESECITRVVDDGPGQVDEKYRKVCVFMLDSVVYKLIVMITSFCLHMMPVNWNYSSPRPPPAPPPPPPPKNKPSQC